MSPALEKGDLVVVEGATYFFRDPRRGEILAFETSGMTNLPAFEVGKIHIKRLVGLPGDRVRITNGQLFVNDSVLILRNEAGEIRYINPRGQRYLASSEDTATTPPGYYFVLGDNSADSADSRYLGFLPVQNVRGRVVWRYGPLSRMGSVR